MEVFRPFQMPNIIRVSPEISENVPNIKNYLISHRNDLKSNGWFQSQRKEAMISIIILISIIGFLVIILSFT